MKEVPKNALNTGMPGSNYSTNFFKENLVTKNKNCFYPLGNILPAKHCHSTNLPANHLPPCHLIISPHKTVHNQSLQKIVNYYNNIDNKSKFLVK